MCRSTLDVALLPSYAVPLGVCLVAAVAVIAVWLAPRSVGVQAKRITLGAALVIVGGVAFVLIQQARSAYIATNGLNVVASAGFVKLEFPLSAAAWQAPVDASGIELPLRELGTRTGSVELGRFRTQTGHDVFVLRTSPSSLLIPIQGRADLILDRHLYDHFVACLAQRR